MKRLLPLLCLLVAAAAHADNCSHSLAFAEPVLTQSVSTAVVGDFDEDGRPDVATMIGGFDRVVWLNRAGIFVPMQREGLRGSFVLIAAADVNGDGHLDLVYRTATQIDVAPGRGDGTFGPLVHSVARPTKSTRWRLIDFDHDGRTDFVNFDDREGAFSFLQANADATFSEVSHYVLTAQSQFIDSTAGDFDGDGNIDVAQNFGNQQLTIGWSDGQLHFARTDDRADLASRLEPLDIDGDGAEELVGVRDGALVVVRAKNRHVTVERVQVAPPGLTERLIAPVMVDIDGDGAKDLVYCAGGRIGVIWGTADGTFRGSAFFELGGTGVRFAVADIDSDGHPDLIASGGESGLPMLAGADLAARRYLSSRLYAFGFDPPNAQFGDVDGDGIVDLVAASRDAAIVNVMFGDGHGSFARAATPRLLDQSAGSSVFVADFDGDGRADAAVNEDYSLGKHVVLFGAADGFSGSALTIDADRIVGRVFLDATTAGLIAVKGSDVQLITISSGRSITTSKISAAAAGAAFVVDVPAGNPPQLLLTSSGGFTLLTRLSEGTWNANTIALAIPLSSVTQVRAVDFNGDGREDLAISGDSAAVLIAQANGTYARALLDGAVDTVAPVDFDGDGAFDLVGAWRGNIGSPGTVRLMRNSGANTFTTVANITSGPLTPGGGIEIRDVDGDGQPDVIVPTFHGIEVMRAVCAPPRVAVAPLPPEVTEGTRVVLAIRTSSGGAGGGMVTVRENGVVLAREGRAGNLTQWTSSPLAVGAHTFRVMFENGVGGSVETTVSVLANAVGPRRRSVKH